MSTLIRRLIAQVIADDPDPQPSQLDRWDGARDLCMVLACTDTATAERHGWRTCDQHAPALERV